eukprot:Amastigsp_a2894_11.p1 type:complete len:454 gc:universal Amastigsp_a2894_11:1478-117(-)
MAQAAVPEHARSSRHASNHKFLHDIAELYTGNPDEESDMKGLCDVAQMLNLRLLPPSRKVTVLLLGNHSSGKSSFINWYIGEKVLKTGAAIETQGIAFVTSGKRHETLKGQASLRLFPRFRGLERFQGVADLVETEVVPSTAHAFSELTLIDTPGLVDGSFVYPFDVEEVLLFLAAQVDIILVFFDPMGQALCTRTMRVVSQLHEHFPEKVSHVLSKIDTVESDADRQNVLIQVIQNLTAHIRPKTALRLPSIFLPKLGVDPTDADNNGLVEVVSNIDRAINATVQRNLERAKADSEDLARRLSAIAKDQLDKYNANFWASVKSLAFTVALLLALVGTLLFFLAEFELDVPLRGYLPGKTSMPGAVLHSVLDGAVRAAVALPAAYNIWVAGAFAALLLAHQIVTRCCWAQVRALDGNAATRARSAYAVCTRAAASANAMFESYLAESVNESAL